MSRVAFRLLSPPPPSYKRNEEGCANGTPLSGAIETRRAVVEDGKAPTTYMRRSDAEQDDIDIGMLTTRNVQDPR